MAEILSDTLAAHLCDDLLEGSSTLPALRTLMHREVRAAFARVSWAEERVK